MPIAERDECHNASPKNSLLVFTPIAQHRFRDVDGPLVKFVTKDTAKKKTVLDEMPKENFFQILADHFPDRCCHSIRYQWPSGFPLSDPSFLLFISFGTTKQRRSPHSLSWAELIKKSFERNPLVDSCGRPMRHIGAVFPPIKVSQ
jgi:hypothetical protein